tara:strand:+ start:46934 stop:47110 length:177 start_codon:yes stop_codon:yes gene_type:complete
MDLRTAFLALCIQKVYLMKRILKKLTREDLIKELKELPVYEKLSITEMLWDSLKESFP